MSAPKNEGTAGLGYAPEGRLGVRRLDAALFA